ncbi:MAG: hypothetical protein CfP315_0430 [Candidatus Improbicoccus pseudotrichonymphae]|uniref:Uncharacterized protein n=1 Tax=Candidatus Improbicoccus pseudotrichonymphae TaxID=3033792 RepID=A0AA48KYH9_9FIRM|nr:MAG: hypothetical protein CfP315_0430 [Candidatus Improbicoccus pseudotrichonymphae]
MDKKYFWLMKEKENDKYGHIKRKEYDKNNKNNKIYNFFIKNYGLKRFLVFCLCFIIYFFSFSFVFGFNINTRVKNNSSFVIENDSVFAKKNNSNLSLNNNFLNSNFLFSTKNSPRLAISNYVKEKFNSIKLGKDISSFGINKSRTTTYNDIENAKKIYFCGNEYFVVNSDTQNSENNKNIVEDSFYIMASRPYLWYPFGFSPPSKNNDKTTPLNVYRDSLIERYLSLNLADEILTPSLESGSYVISKIEYGYPKEDFKQGANNDGFYRLQENIKLKKLDGTPATSLYNDFLKNNSVDLSAIIPCNIVTTYFGFYNAGTTIDLNKIEQSSDSEVRNMQYTINNRLFWLPTIIYDGNQANISCHPLYDYNSEKENNTDISYYKKFSVSPTDIKILTRNPEINDFYGVNHINNQGVSKLDNESKIGATQAICPVCKIDLNSILHIEDSNTHNILTIKKLVQENNNSQKDYSSIVKNITFDENGLKIEVDQDLDTILSENESKNRKYLKVLLDDGNKFHFIELTDSNIYEGVSGENERKNYVISNSELSDLDKNITQIKVYLGEDNTNTNLSSIKDDYKVKYVTEIASQDNGNNNNGNEDNNNNNNGNDNNGNENNNNGNNGSDNNNDDNNNDFTFDVLDDKTGVRVQGYFPIGSKLVVDLIENDKEYLKTIKKNIDNFESIERFKAFEISISDPNGNKIKDNFGIAIVHLPIPNDFEIKDLEARFVLPEEDEVKKGKIMFENQNKKYVFEVTHFSAYVLIDNKNDTTNNPQTGKEMQYKCTNTLCFVITLFWLGIMCFSFDKNKFEKEVTKI